MKVLYDLGVGISHHFSGGVYAKETHIPAGVSLEQHVHSYEHMSVLVSGIVVLSRDSVDETINAPAILTLSGGVVHKVHALKDSVWLCIHATDETDPELVDSILLEK